MRVDIRRFGRAGGAAALIASAAVFVALLRAAGGVSIAQPASSFATTVAALSEKGGYFDTDNLISNERSYLQVVPDLRRQGIRGGAYVGVGPDQNFSYIGEVRPAVAYIIDVRRDNLLLHLLFKALFEISATRVEYLANLLGQPLPPGGNGWRQASIGRLVAYFEKSAESPDTARVRTKRVEEAIRRSGVALTNEDIATIVAFHRRFIDEGLWLRFNSTGRAPQAHYPTYRDLLLETDSAGAQTNYLASEASFQYVKFMHAHHRIIPVVGDLSGPSALQAIGRDIAVRGEKLSAFYVSNVEFYLFGQGSYPRFVTNLRVIPRTNTAVLIRSVFGRYSLGGRPGDASTSQLQQVSDLIGGYDDGRYRSYGALVGR